MLKTCHGLILEGKNIGEAYFEFRFVTIAYLSWLIWKTLKIFTLRDFLMSITVSEAEDTFVIAVFFKEQKIHFLAHIREYLKNILWFV